MSHSKCFLGITSVVAFGVALAACNGSDPSGDNVSTAGAGGSASPTGGSSNAGSSNPAGGRAPQATGGSAGTHTSGGTGGSAGTGPQTPEDLFTCDFPSPDTLASTVGVGWEFVEFVDVDATLANDLEDVGYRVGVGPDNRVVGFDDSDALLVEFGTWPKLAKGNNIDPLPSEHRKMDLDFGDLPGPFLNEGTLIFPYNGEGLNGVHAGGVYLDDGKSRKTLPGFHVGGALRMGDRLLVAAGGFLGEGSSALNAPQQVWSTSISDPTKAQKLVAINAGYSTARMNALGTDVLFRVVTAPSLTELAEEGNHRFSKQALLDEKGTLTMPAASASVHKSNDTKYRFDITDGVVMLSLPALDRRARKIEVLRKTGEALTTEELLIVDFDCLSIASGFAIAGEPVIFLQHRNQLSGRMLHLRPKKP